MLIAALVVVDMYIDVHCKILSTCLMFEKKYDKILGGKTLGDI